LEVAWVVRVVRSCRWRRPAATGCVARVDRRWRVCDPFGRPATSGGCVV